ncbi:hypothetical protein [Maricaulis sp.]|uniref:hypothetical protein n=1 Tax=Maricaulis sp. TaxID=1486257 RepID=UPI0025BDA6EB|nr:hypothetical protein [Maricaulis sp.]
MAKKTQIIIEIDAKGTPQLKGQTKAIKDQTKALKQQGQTTQKTGKKARTYHQRQEKGVIGVANQTKSFSKMQQTMDGGGGAGGLVRAYALLAANVFALSMAFGVLSRSAQVDTLTQAMERLEVVSGKAIRGLARDLQEASGYGMDFADSMRATSLALSAGFDSSTVSELAEVARNASVSLGRNMADGLDRIFRGVIKVEPELLDEIGLFVRVREAAARYASELGVAAADLTEFQRRQAFANEALRQGKEKFADFADIETDPFSQLAAKFSDIAQQLMSMLNKAIVPFINLLMSSKAILMGVFLGIAAALLKKAIPAMGIMNRSAQEQAKIARANHLEIMSGIDTETRRKMDAAQQEHAHALQAIRDNEQIAISREKAIMGSGKFGMGKTQGGKQAEKDYKIAVKAKDLDGQRNALIAKRDALNKSSAYNKSRGNKQAIKEIGQEKAAITKVIKKLDDQILHTNEIVRLNKELEGSMVVQGQLLDRQEKKLANKELTTASLATVTNTAETKGMTAAWAQFKTEIPKVNAGLKGTNILTRNTTMAMFKLKGAFSIASVGAQRLMMALGPVMMLISIVVPLFMGLMKLLGFFSEEAKAVTTAQKNLEEQTKMLTKKLEHQRAVYADSTATSENYLDAMLAQKIGVMEVIKSLEELQKAQEEYEKNTAEWVQKTGASWEKLWDFINPAKLNRITINSDIAGSRVVWDWEDPTAEHQAQVIQGILGDPDNMSQAMKDYFAEIDAGKMQGALDLWNQEIKGGEDIIKDARTKLVGLRKSLKDAGDFKEKKEIKELIKLQKERIKKAEEFNSIVGRDRARLMSQSGLEMEEIGKLQAREIAGEQNLQSVRKGANDALREFRDKFITKTDVDKPLASFSQLITGLEMDKEKMVATDKAIVESLKGIVQEESAIFSMMSKDRQEAYKEAMGFVEGVEGTDIVDMFFLPDLEKAKKILEEQKVEYELMQKTIIRNKQELKDITTQEKLIKNLRKESVVAIRLAFQLEEKKRDLLLEQERITVRQAMLANNISDTKALELFDTGQIDALMTHMKEEGLATANSHSIIVKLLQLQNVELQTAFEEATRSLRLDKERTELALKRVKLAEKLSAEEAKDLEITRQLKAFKETGTTKLTSSQELLAMIEAEGKRMEHAKDRFDLEEKVIKAKYNILIAEWDLLKAKAEQSDKEYLQKLRIARDEEVRQRTQEFGGRDPQVTMGPAYASWAQAAADMKPERYAVDRAALKKAADLEVDILEQAHENLATDYAVKLRTKIGDALKSSFSTDIMPFEETNLSKMLMKMDVAKIFRDQITTDKGKLETEQASLREQLEGAGTEEEKEGIQEKIDAIQEKLNNMSTEHARAEISMLNAVLMQFADTLRELGPGGNLAATVAEFSVGFVNGLMNMRGAIEGLNEKFKDEEGLEGGMTDLQLKSQETAEKLAVAGNAIGGIANIMAAASANKVAGIDREIEAEKKRDGKSKASVAKIAALEAKKEKQKKKAFEQNKKMLMAQTIMNTAAGIMKTMGELGFWGIPMAILIGAMGAAQLAVISGMTYEGGGAAAGISTPSEISVGERGNKVDVSQRASAGELAYLRGARGIGTSATAFTPTGGAAGLRRGYADGGEILVGERGPEQITPLSPMQVWPSNMGAKSQINANFTIHAIDAQGVEDVLLAQQGNIIGMIRSAANDHGEEFLEAINTDMYGEPKSAGGVDY